MKEVLNIVVTGGPCGGKTTALDEITKLLRSYGYTVYIVNETATELMNDGIKPFGEGNLSKYTFQEVLFDAQVEKERIRKISARLCSNDKVAIIYDRGLLDGKAYLPKLDFEEILEKRCMTESKILSRYDLVLHMTSTAVGKRECYTLDNNSARFETAEEAVAADKRTLECWKNHPNLIVFANDCSFNEKIERVKNAIRRFIGEEEVIKKERYLVNSMNLDEFKYDVVKEEIEEFVDKYDNENDVVYTKSTINGSSYYTYSKNSYNKDGSKVTNCRTISEEEYLENINKIKGIVVRKTRYNFIDNNERYRLDMYDNLTILERDVVFEDRKDLPLFIKSCTDISNDRNYNDDSLFVDYNINRVYSKRFNK